MILQNDKLLTLPLFLCSSPFLGLSAKFLMRGLLFSRHKQEHPSGQAYIDGFLKAISRFTSAASCRKQ